MKTVWLLLSTSCLLLISACTASINGVSASTGQQYYSPYSAGDEGTAIVYIYWNQADLERYIPFGTKKPIWNTYVNRKKNAELDEGSYSVVETKPGRVTIEARARFGSSTNISDRSAHLGFGVKAGETYYVTARMVQGSVGLELVLDRQISEREAFNQLYGLRYQKNLQETMLY